jgi:DNA polymerase III gamma/tau subunit
MDLERAEKFEHKTTASSMDFFPSAKALSDKSQQLFKAGSAAEPDYVLRMERQMKEMATQLKGLSHEVKELEETNYQATHHAPTAKSMESELEKEKHAKKVAKAVPQAATHKPIAKAPLPASHHTQAKQQHAKPHTVHSKPARSMEEEGEANDNDNDNILANVGNKVVEVGTSVLDKVGSGVDNAIAASAQEGGLLDRFGHSVDSWLGVDREGSSKSKSKSKKMSAKAHSANEGMLNKLSNMMLSEDEDAYGVNDDDY